VWLFSFNQGSSGTKKLDNLANNFERGKVDTFVVNSLALGTEQLPAINFILN
jgi:hypothetical protein